MNAQASEVAQEATPSNEEIVLMEDGRKVPFVGKRQVLKEALVNGAPFDASTPIDPTANTLAVRLDFRNGTSRTYEVNQNLLANFALHGALQKYGDELAGGVKLEDGTQSTDLDDWAATTDRLHERLSEGKWSIGRTGDSMGGTSVLLKALIEASGKPVTELREWLKGKSQKEKSALRNSAKLKPIVERIESEKASAGAKVDTDALLAELA
jgi:hypothetical protein